MYALDIGDVMKLIAALVLALSLIWPFGHKPQPIIQQQATHMVTFLNEDGGRDGLCTATAIGPHAILTAEHCDETTPDGLESKSLNIDLSTRTYRIVAHAEDHHDHLILLLDGPAFRNIEEVSTRGAVVGEHVFMYGDGLGTFPARRLDGSIINTNDPSDVDKDQGMSYFTLRVIPGDSGSAVYGDDGRIVALVTYSISYGKAGWFHQALRYGAGFSLAFTDEQIIIARHFELPKE